MTTYTWPTSGRAFAPESMIWTQRHNNRASASPLSGAVQTTGLPGSRWGLTLNFGRQTYAERALIEGWLTRLEGQANRVSIWDLARATPANLSGSPLVNGALAQFATVLNIDGTLFAGANLLRFSQSIDDVYWTKTRATVTANATTAPDGTTTADKLVEDAATGAHHAQRSALSFVAGQSYAASVYVKAAERAECLVQIGNSAAFAVNPSVRVNLTTGAINAQSASAQSVSVVDAGSGWWRTTVAGVATTTATDVVFMPFIVNGGLTTYAGTVGSGIYVWGAQLVNGLAPLDYTGLPSASPGDWLSLPLSGGGSQLVQVVNSTVGETLTGVEFRPMLRGAVADNAAIGIVNPAALFVLASPELSVPRGASGMCPPFSVELMEVFS